MLTAVRIPRGTFASIVTERLSASIIDGTLKPGAQLNEVELATSFGVSRGPVREALQRLVQEGLLDSEPHRGVFVPVLTEDLVHEHRRICDLMRAGETEQALFVLARALRRRRGHASHRQVELTDHKVRSEVLW